MENIITFKIKTGYYLEILSPETMKLLGSPESNGESLPHLEITEAVLFHYNIVDNNYQQDSIILYTFVHNKPFWQFIRNFTKKSYLFKNV